MAEKCFTCGAEFPVHEPGYCGGAGYGVDREGHKHCYTCCGERDKADMRREGKIVLYLTKKDGEYRVINWPSSIVFIPWRVKKGRTNWWGVDRYDVWFNFEGETWWGVNKGDNEILRCRRTKSGRKTS